MRAPFPPQKPTDLASSAADGTVHKATDSTTLFLTAVRWHRQDLQRQATVVAIGPQLQLNAVSLGRGGGSFRSLSPLPENS